jgi:pyruvate dehydrogenase E2 component (dihydrolipoamide acetyltransferase)
VSNQVAKEVVTVPDLGGADEVSIIELCLSVGDSVELEQSLLVLESDKATMDVPSPVAGSLAKYLVADGDTVRVGDPIAEIELSSDNPDSSETAVQETPDAPQGNQSQSNQSDTNKPPAVADPSEPDSESQEQIVLVPDIGSEDKIEVIELSVSVGDAVEEGDTLVVLESDKATMDVPSSHTGIIVDILVTEGDKLGTGDQVAKLQLSGSKTVVQVPVETAVAPVDNKAETPAVPEVAPSEQPKAATVSSVTASNENVYAGPAVRLLARELGVDLTQVNGTGPKGRIQKDDLNNYVKSALQAPSQPQTHAGIPQVPAIDFSQFGEVETVKLSKIQRITADNMHRNWLNVPHVTQFDDADITDLEEFRKSLKEESEKRGIRVTPVAFLIKAIAATLAANPAFNRSLTADGESYIQKHYIHVGMAVDTPRGLVVPVIRDVDKKGIWQLSADIMDLADKARQGALKPSDMQGGCFTLSSLGAIGGQGFTPIVNSPEVGILGVSKSQIKPVWNGAEFVPRLMLPLSLSYDHRLINGGDAGRFMTHLVKLLGNIGYLAL